MLVALMIRFSHIFIIHMNDIAENSKECKYTCTCEESLHKLLHKTNIS